MRSYPAILHCYARPENSHYIAVCLELNLCDRGETLEQAKASLEDDLACYFLDSDPVEVITTGSKLANNVLTITFADGSMATIFSTISGRLKTRSAPSFPGQTRPISPLSAACRTA